MVRLGLRKEQNIITNKRRGISLDGNKVTVLCVISFKSNNKPLILDNKF